MLNELFAVADAINYDRPEEYVYDNDPDSAPASSAVSRSVSVSSVSKESL